MSAEFSFPQESNPNSDVTEPVTHDETQRALVTEAIIYEFGTNSTEYMSLVKYAASLRMRSTDEAEDIVQSAFEKTLRYASSYDQSRAFRPWLAGTVKRTALDHKRRKQRELRIMEPLNDIRGGDDTNPSYEPTSTTDPVAEMVLQAETIESVREAIGKLSPIRREVIELTLSGMTHSEMAMQLHVPLGTIKSRIDRAYTELRKNTTLQELFAA